MAKGNRRLRIDRRHIRRRGDRRAPSPYEGVYLRSFIIIFFITIGFFGVASKLVWLGLAPVSEPQANIRTAMVEAPVRGAIYDRNGILMASTLRVHSLYADPSEILDVDETIAKLSQIFPDISSTKIRKRLQNHKRRFAWLKRKISPVQVKAVNDLGLPGIYFRNEMTRIYPQGNLAAHIIGGINIDQQGVSGIEGSFNEALIGGEDIALTVDLRLQEQLHRTLNETIKKAQAKGAWGVVLDSGTADILAMVSLPDYDPNHYGKAPKNTWLNKTNMGIYEMGSTFKILTMAQAFDENYVTAESEIDCRKPLKIGKYTINDSHPKYEIMTVREVFTRSSNIGVAQVADKFTRGSQMEFFRKLNLLDEVSVGFASGVTPRYPKRVGRIHQISMSYGHGIAISPIQMVAAVNSLVGDGYYKTPNIVQYAVRDKPRRAVKDETVAFIRDLMGNVVRNGTGRKAQVAGYNIGGKTGTAEKASAGGYDKKRNLSSFVGVVPIDKPKLVTLIMVDEGREGYNSGGLVAAPAFSAFIRGAAPLLGIAPEGQGFDVAVLRKQFEAARLAGSARD